ncbi:MAG TPA: hypothetical protein VK593_08485 [Edaphobacter sp.]|nr:hypothetical protein [Edaphobacter sp.]
MDVYLMELSTETDQRAIQLALATLARMDRRDGETAIPTVGRILAVAETSREFSGRRDSRYDYFPPDREPVYAPHEGFPPPRLAGERLLRAILSEIRDVERSLGLGGIELTPESTRQRYEHLCEMLRDPVGYDRKRLAGGVL